MTRGAFILLWIFLTSLSVSAQTLTLADSIFAVGARLERRQIYTPDCQLDARHLAFIDSLVTFLVKNPRVKINIEFYGDGYDGDDFEKEREKICGQRRLGALFDRHPELNQKRIQYVFHGNSNPIYTKNEILQMTERSDQTDAYRKNRRTVIVVTELNFDSD